MAGWKQSRKAREAIAFLSDLGGAVIAVSTGVSCVVAAIIYATRIFDGGIMLVIALGFFLITFGTSLHMLRQRLAPPPAPAAPDDQAAAPERLNEAGQVRQAARLIREELLDNLSVIQDQRSHKSLDEPYDYTVWNREEENLVQIEDPAAFQGARQAYRTLQLLEQRQHSFEPLLGSTWDRSAQNELQAAAIAIREAASKLEAV